VGRGELFEEPDEEGRAVVDQDDQISWETLRERLTTHQVCTVALRTDTGDVLRIRKSSIPERHHRAVYQLLDVPEQIISTRKTRGLTYTTGKKHGD